MSYSSPVQLHQPHDNTTACDLHTVARTRLIQQKDEYCPPVTWLSQAQEAHRTLAQRNTMDVSEPRFAFAGQQSVVPYLVQE